MQTLEQIRLKLAQKEQALNGVHQIITPDSGISPKVQTRWMIELLQAMYIEHGIAKSPAKVEASIADGDCRCWFVLESGRPVALAALIRQSDGSMEIGRAVALEPGLGLGSIAMMRACLDQIENGDAPLVAEVRVADNFAGIPSGEATQRNLFGHLGLKPHALAPMFNHGDPIRQEPFALATSQDRQSSAALVLPDNRQAQQVLRPVVDLNGNLFDSRVQQKNATATTANFELVQEAPFSVLVPSHVGSSLEVAEDEALELNNFALLPVELSPANSGLVLECLEAGWVACGVDRNLGPDSHPVLLLGKLKTGTLLAPARIVSENLSGTSVQALRQVDRNFRK